MNGLRIQWDISLFMIEILLICCQHIDQLVFRDSVPVFVYTEYNIPLQFWFSEL